MANIEQRRHQTSVQSQSQSANQKISQKQIQAISFLSMSNAELSKQIQNLIQENPFVKVKHRKKSINIKTANSFQTLLESKEDYTESLQAHLLHQVNMLPLSQTEAEICKMLIYNLDKNGCYGSMLDPQSLLDYSNPKHTVKTLNKCINLIQSLDPVGTCCKTLEESLFVQAKLKKNAPQLALFILNGHLDFLDPPYATTILKKLNQFKNDWHKKAFAPPIILDNIHLDEDVVEKTLLFIKTLNPRPAQSFSYDTSFSQSVFSDIVLKVEKLPGHIPYDDFGKGLISTDFDFHFQIKYSSGELPDIFIDESFILNNSDNSDSAKKTKQLIAQAQDFIENLRFRESTLILQGCAIVKYQKAFFEKGAKHLVSLTRAQVADFLGIHESTVSRISSKKNSKYIQTDWGVLPLNYFFSSGVLNSQNESVSSTVIKTKIQEYIGQSPENALSDSKLEKILKAEGINISRRTIAKYRKQAGIENSYHR